MIGLSELLTARGFRPDPQRAKLVRHKDARLDMDALRTAGWFETYQKFQSKPVFDGCDQIVVFCGERGSSARFVGVYQVGVRLVADQSLLPPECPYRWNCEQSGNRAAPLGGLRRAAG